MRLGFGLGLGGKSSPSVGGGSTDPAVTIAWTTLSNNRTPSFLINATNWLGTDVLEFQLDSDPAFSSVIESNIGAIIGLPATITSDVLADGTYYARARITRGGTPFAWSSTATVTISYQGPAPIAGAVSASVDFNTAKPINVSSFISGGTHTSVAVASSASHGTMSVSGDVITYTPTTGYSGADSFTYTATGPGGTSAPATVSLTVANFTRIDSSTVYFTSSTIRIDG